MIDKISSILKALKATSKEQQELKLDTNSSKEAVTAVFDEEKRIYRGEYPPLRKLFLWGWDEQNNPGFLVLYGEHKFRKENYGNNELADCVTYTDYAIFKGEAGHFPSFEAVEIWDTYNYKKQRTEKKMYYKRDLRVNGSWYCSEEEMELKSFVSLKEPILIPYFTSLIHEDYTEFLTKQDLPLHGFRLAKNQGEVLALKAELADLYERICQLLSNPNLYLRKKYLNEILDLNPPKMFYEFVLTVGSEELISGLFLELAKRNNDVLVSEAERVINEGFAGWNSQYIQGIKRCATIYHNLFDETIKNNQTNFIREHLSEIDLKLLYLNEQKIPEDRKFEGTDYRRFSLEGRFSEYTGRYSYEQRKYIRYRRSNLFAKSYYSDGVTLDIIKLKNTIQEAELLGLADVVGTIAYYCDAPRLVYYLKGNSLGRSLKYFRRYLRRIIDNYAKTDEAKFIEAMKSLFIRYEEGDYLSKYKGNFQESYFIKQFLYYDFNEKKPDDWYEGFEWIKEDQLKKLNGRYEFRKDIWDRHLEEVLEILCNAKIEVILKAFYYILNDSENKAEFMQGLSYERLVKLSEAPYHLVAELAVETIIQRLEMETIFDSNIMVSLINCSNQQICQIALEYFSRTKGKFSASGLVGFLSLDNLVEWTDLFAQGIERLDEDEYLEFIKVLVSEYGKENREYPETLNDILEQSLSRLEGINILQRTTLLADMISCLCTEKTYIPFIEKVVFSMSLEQLENSLSQVEIAYPTLMPQRSMATLAFLDGIKNNQLPSDSQIIEILDSATSGMVRTLVAILAKRKELLKSRFSTVLILFEADVMALNEQAKEIFNQLEGAEQKKLHSILLDSPDEKVYSFGLEKLYEIYEQPGMVIPEDLVIQMFEHSAAEVKAYISDKLLEIIRNLGNGNQELFLYYVKTLLLLPNKVSLGKKHIYEILPLFVKQYQDKQRDVEAMLLEIGGSNIILDSERALVALAQIRKGVI